MTTDAAAAEIQERLENPWPETTKLFARYFDGEGPKPIKSLENGAAILAQAPHRDGNHVVVLADTGPHQVQRLVCWVVKQPSRDNPKGYAFWGRYGSEALPAFTERAAAPLTAETAMLAGLLDIGGLR